MKYLSMGLVLVLATADVSAAASPAAKCAIAKSKAAAKKVLADVKCWKNAFADGAETPDEECLNKAANKLAAAIAKADGKGGCLIEEDVVPVTDATETCVESIIGLTPSGAAGCYVGVHPTPATPAFNFNGYIGLAAADSVCNQLSPGGHMCTYSELLAAQTAGQLSGVSDATTFWLQRDITADVNGSPSPAGPGGNCNDWTFVGDHLADGEYVTFSSGVPTYHLDDDTIYDFTTNHAQPGVLQCSASRSIPCCVACE